MWLFLLGIVVLICVITFNRKKEDNATYYKSQFDDINSVAKETPDEEFTSNDCIQTLADVINCFLNKSFRDVCTCIYESKIYNDINKIYSSYLNSNFYDRYDKISTSYHAFFSEAFHAAKANNGKDFAGWLLMICSKIRLAQRIYYDDIYFVEKLAEQLNMEYHCEISVPVLSENSFPYFIFEECNYNASANLFYRFGMTKDDLMDFFPTANYEFFLEEDYESFFSQALNSNQQMREFIAACDVFSIRGNPLQDNAKYLEYLIISLMLQYSQSDAPWNRVLSECIIKNIVLCHRFIRYSSIKDATDRMNSIIQKMIRISKNTIDLFQGKDKNLKNELANLFINIYHLYDIPQIFDYLSETFSDFDENGEFNYAVDNGIKNYIECELIDLYRTNTTINTSHMRSDIVCQKSEINNAVIDYKDQKKNYITIFVSGRTVDNPKAVELKLYDINNTIVSCGKRESFVIPFLEQNCPVFQSAVAIFNAATAERVEANFVY